MSSYGDLARFYDGEYGAMSADIGFYLRALADERVFGPVLELGCGTGRIAVPLAEAGHRVTGLDCSAAMLRRARRRRRSLPAETAIRLRFSLQDMRTFRFPRPFSAAVVAFSSFNLLPTADDRRACLARLAAALEPGAPLLMDLAAPRLAASVLAPHQSTFLLPPRAHVVEKIVTEEADDLGGALRVRYSYLVRHRVDGREVDRLEVGFTLSRVERGELESACYEAGFDVESVAGDYRGTPLRPEHARLVVRARRLG